MRPSPPVISFTKAKRPHPGPETPEGELEGAAGSTWGQESSLADQASAPAYVRLDALEHVERLTTSQAQPPPFSTTRLRFKARSQRRLCLKSYAYPVRLLGAVTA